MLSNQSTNGKFQISIYGKSYVCTIEKNDLIRKLCNVFRFIVDLNVINDGEKFENNFRYVYPEELKLNKQNAVTLWYHF